MQDNIYQNLTRAFNDGRLRVILSSGQAVVMHRLAVMSKDGDWIAREDQESLDHILAVLENRGARYRFGAPLDVRWMAGGWSSHYEFRTDTLRVRTDFVTRPPRIDQTALAAQWVAAERRQHPIPFVDAATLAELKKTNRERDYAVIGELARLIGDPKQQLLLSRSARELQQLARDHSELLRDVESKRRLLRHVADGLDALEAALDAERRQLIRANQRRLQAYMDAAQAWAEAWPSTLAEVSELPLRAAHEVVVRRAETLLPTHVEVTGP